MTYKQNPSLSDGGQMQKGGDLEAQYKMDVTKKCSVKQYGSHKRTNTVAFHYRYNYEVTKVEYEIARSWGGTNTKHSIAQLVILVLRRVRQDCKFKVSLQGETNKQTIKPLITIRLVY